MAVFGLMKVRLVKRLTEGREKVEKISFPSQGKFREFPVSFIGKIPRFSLPYRGKKSSFSFRHFGGKKSVKFEIFPWEEKPIYYVYRIFPSLRSRGK